MSLLKNRPFALLLGGAMLIALGRGVFLTISVVFASKVIGMSAAQIGTALAIAGGCSLVAAFPLGVLADRFSVKGMFLIAITAQTISLAGFAASWNMATYVLSMSAFTVFYGAQFPMYQAIVGALCEEDPSVERATVLSINRSLRNFCIALGSLAALPYLQSGDPALGRAMVGTIAALTAVSIFLILRVPVPARTAGREKTPLKKVLRAATDWRFVLVAMTANSSTFVFFLLSVAPPLIVIAAEGVSDTILTVIMITNTLMVVSLQFSVGKRIHTLGRARVGLVITGGCLAVGCLFLGLSTLSAGTWATIVLLLTAVVVISVGELVQAAVGWEISFSFAPPEQRTTYLSLWNMSYSIYDLIAPLVITSLVLPHGLFGFAALGVALLGLSVAAATFTTLVARRREIVID